MYKPGRGVFFALTLVFGCQAWGGVHVSLRLEQRETLLFEPIRAYVSFYNDSDYPYVMDAKDSGRASRFSIEVHRGNETSLVTERSAPIKYLYLMPDEREEVMIDLSEHYALAALGRYRVTAVAAHHGEYFQSKQSILDIVSGIEVAKTVRSVPDYPGTLRSYSLRKWPRGGISHLFLSVDEPRDGYNYGVFDLGPFIQSDKPIVRVDRKGSVTVVHPCSPDCFTRTQLSSSRDRVSLLDQTYHLPNGDPYPLNVKAPSLPPEPPKPAKRWWQFWKWGR